MKYKNIFKKWYFWVLIVMYSLMSIINHINTFGNIFIVEILGIFIGSFVIIWIIASLIYLIVKIFNRKKKT